MSLTSADDSGSSRDLACCRGRKGRLFGLTSSMRSLFGRSKKKKQGKVFHHTKPDSYQPAEEGRALSQSSFFSTDTSHICGPGGSSSSGSRPNSGSSSPANGGNNARRAVSPLAVTPTKPAIARVSSETDTDTPSSRHSGAYDTIDEVDEEEDSSLGTPRPHTPRMRQQMRLPAYDELVAVSPDYGQGSLSPASQMALRKKIAEAARVAPSPSFCSMTTTTARIREPHVLGRIPKKGAKTSSPGCRSDGASSFDGATNSSKDKPRHILDRGVRRNSSNYYNYSDYYNMSSPVRSISSSMMGPDYSRGHHYPGCGRSSGRSAMAAHGRHPSAADTAIIRAANEGHISPTAVAEVSDQEKVIMNETEKCFIQSLSQIDTGENSTLPPLLAPARPPQRFGPLASPCAPKNQDEYVGSCVIPLGPKKTLVLDLDETLISSTRTPCACDFLIVFKIHDREPPPATRVVDNEVEDNDEHPDQYDEDVEEDPETASIKQISYYVRLRPGLAKFLSNASAMYELVVWTASGKSYADAVIDLLDPDNKLFAHRLYRESCVKHRGLCVKDLRRLGRPMSSVLLLDNYIYSFGFTLNNGMPISPWTGAEGSDESGLMIAIALLQKIARARDVRTPLIKTFDLHRAVHGTRSSTLTPVHLHRLNSCVSEYRSTGSAGPLSPSSSTTSGSSSGSGGSSSSSWRGKSFNRSMGATPRVRKSASLRGSGARESQLASAADEAANAEARGTRPLE